MNEHLSEVKASLEDLSRRVKVLEDRVRSLERFGEGGEPADHKPDRTRDTPRGVSAPEPDAPETGHKSSGIGAAGILSYAGRSLILLGGGFLLRAITESGVLSRPLGTTLALLYGLVLIGFADQVGKRGKNLSAFLYGLIGVLIVFPVLTEATLKYSYLSVEASITGVAATTLAVLAVAWHRSLSSLSWLVILAAAISILALAIKGTGLITAGYWFDVLGVVTLWIAYSRKWFGLAWLTAFFVDLLILVFLVLVFGVADAETRFGLAPVGVIGVQFAAVAAYLGTIATRTIIRHRDVLLFEVAQTLVLLVLWLGSALKLAPSVGPGITPLGIGCIVLAAGCYGVAFALVDRRAGGRRNFIFYTSLAIVFALFGGGVLLEPTARALLFVGMALLTTAFSLRYSRMTLFGHSVFYIISAAMGSGLFGAATGSFRGSEPGFGPWLSFSVLAVLVSGVIMSLAPIATRKRTWGPLARVPRLLLFGFVVYCLSGLMVAILAALPLVDDPAGSVGVMEAFRTVALALSILLLATLGKRRGIVEATWLAYVFLVLAGIKLAVEDVPAGRAVTMFVSFGVYGGVLILVSRMLRRSPRSE